MNKFNDKTLIVLPYLIFIFIFTVPLILMSNLYCFHAGDMGIYGHAIKNLSLDNLNPYNSVHLKHIFNDHFDPIIILPSLFAKIFRVEHLLIITESLFVLLSTIPIIILYKKNKLNLNFAALFILILLFGTATRGAINFPSHPTTWSILPIMFLCFYIKEENTKLAIISFISTCFFKEEFQFIGLPIAFTYILKKQYKTSIIYLIIALIFITFNFKIRTILWPYPTYDHGGPLVKSLFENPFNIFFNTDKPGYIFLLKTLFPFLILFYFTRTFNFTYIFIASPLILIRFLSNKWGGQYTIPLIPFFLFSIFPIQYKIEFNFNKITHFLPYLILISYLLLPSTIRDYNRLKVYINSSPNNQTCPKSFHRIKEINACVSKISNIDTSVLGMGNLIPFLVNYSKNVSQFQDVENIENFNLIIFEKKHGDPYPLDKAYFEKLNLNLQKNLSFKNFSSDEIACFEKIKK